MSGNRATSIWQAKPNPRILWQTLRCCNSIVPWIKTLESTGMLADRSSYQEVPRFCVSRKRLRQTFRISMSNGKLSDPKDTTTPSSWFPSTSRIKSGQQLTTRCTLNFCNRNYSWHLRLKRQPAKLVLNHRYYIKPIFMAFYEIP